MAAGDSQDDDTVLQRQSSEGQQEPGARGHPPEGCGRAESTRPQEQAACFQDRQ